MRHIDPKREAYKLDRIFAKVNKKYIILTKAEFNKARERAKRYGW